MYKTDTNKNEELMIHEGEACHYSKQERYAFFNEKNTACYLSRACIESLLKASDYSLDSMDTVCKIT